MSGLHTLLAEPIFAVHEGILALLGQAELATAKPGFVDRVIHASYSNEGISLVTFEKAAGKLANVELLAGIEETTES